MPKDCGLSLAELLDEGRAVLTEGHGEVNRRWKKEFTAGGYQMVIHVRISMDDPQDYSILLFAQIQGFWRCICRLDGSKFHNMAIIGLPRIEGPHMHWLTERYQRMGKGDSVWAEPLDVGGFDEGMLLFVRCLNINVYRCTRE